MNGFFFLLPLAGQAAETGAVSLQTLALLGTAVLAVASIGIAIGAVRRDVLAHDKTITTNSERLKALEDARIVDAFERGVLTQRVNQLESGSTRTSSDIANIEARFRAEMVGMETRLIGHIDRLAGEMRSIREDTGPRSMKELGELRDRGGRG